MEIFVAIVAILMCMFIIKISVKEKRNTKDSFEKFSAISLIFICVIGIVLSSMFLIDRIVKLIL